MVSIPPTPYRLRLDSITTPPSPKVEPFPTTHHATRPRHLSRPQSPNRCLPRPLRLHSPHPSHRRWCRRRDSPGGDTCSQFPVDRRPPASYPENNTPNLCERHGSGKMEGSPEKLCGFTRGLRVQGESPSPRREEWVGNEGANVWGKSTALDGCQVTRAHSYGIPLVPSDLRSLHPTDPARRRNSLLRPRPLWWYLHRS